jgi:hypothetical protein
LFSLVVFASPIAACFVLARRFTRDPAWHGCSLYSISTASGVVVLFVLTSVAVATGDNEAGSAGTRFGRSTVAMRHLEDDRV